MHKSSRTMLLALMVATTPWLVAPVIAAPITSPLMLRSAVVPSVETVQYRRGYGYGRRSRRARHRRRADRRGDYWRNTTLRLLRLPARLLRSGLRRSGSLRWWRRSRLLCATLQVL